MNAIEVRGLTRRFGPFVAVDHVTFDVAEGEIFGFLGSNGAGDGSLNGSVHALLVSGTDLYVGGEFVGGCDIMMEMMQKGELAPLVKEATAQAQA